ELVAGAGDGVGVIDAEAPAGDVEVVDAVVAHVAGAILPQPAPAVGVAVGVEGMLAGGGLPGVPVEALGGGGGPDGGGRGGDAAAELAVPRLGHVDLAELAVLYVFDGRDVVRDAAALCADLHDAVVGAGGGDHLLALEDVVRDGLLDVDVFLRLAAPDGGE